MSEWYGREDTRKHVESDSIAYVVAEEGGEVVGYVSGGPGDEEGVATLGAIYVDPDHWNEGIGTALLSAFEGFCRQGATRRSGSRSSPRTTWGCRFMEPTGTTWSRSERRTCSARTSLNASFAVEPSETTPTTDSR